MNIDMLLDRLEGVRRTGDNRWIAKCPAHEDRSPSLSVRDADGTVLLHCFAGCAPSEVISAVGLEMSDLFSEENTFTASRPRIPRIPAGDILQCISGEFTVGYLAMTRMRNGEALSEEDWERFVASIGRIWAARDMT